jgi:glycosyltransferase involved in cell wall biosynthesis
MKVLWICHFSNSTVQAILKPWKPVAQYAPWIGYTVPIFEKMKDIDLYVISPHEYIHGIRQFELRGVHYSFFNPYIPFWGRHWPVWFKWDGWTKYRKNKRLVGRIVKQIDPDVIHLQGAENPYYSSTVLQFMGKVPIVVNLQRINLDFLTVNSYRAKIERSIVKNASTFSIRTKTMKKQIIGYRPDANIYWINYGMPDYKPIPVQKEFDVVFFARVCKEKGIEDLIKALGLVREILPQVSLMIIGGVGERYKAYLSQMAEVNGVGNIIHWKGYLQSLDLVHREASKARISVLPTYNDIIPGTIIESMQLGLPVVSYKAGSIPELNEEKEIVLLSEIGDIEGLAESMLKLLSDNDLLALKSKQGIEYIKKKYSNLNVQKQHLDCYREVIADFHRDKQQKLTTENTEKHRHR